MAFIADTRDLVFLGICCVGILVDAVINGKFTKSDLVFFIVCVVAFVITHLGG